MIKEFLNIDDIAVLFNKNGYNFDLSRDNDKDRLLDFIFDLVKEYRLYPAFYYQGKIKILEVEYIDNEGFDIYDGEFYIHRIDIDSKEVALKPQSRYCYVESLEDLINIYTNHNKTFKIDEIKFSLVYKFYEKAGFYYDYKMLDKDQAITVFDLRYPSKQIYALFNQQSPQVLQDRINNGIKIHNELQTEIKRLKNIITELEQQVGNDSQSDTATDEPLKGIAKVNYDKDKAKAFASIVAKFLWNIDTNQQLRIGEMATQLYPLIHEFDNNALPQGNDTIKDWIRPHAPKYASKAGNTPRSQPPIILTLKK